MTRSGIGKIHQRSLSVKKQKREHMETRKPDVELTSKKRRSAWKRSSGKRGRKKFPVSSRKITSSGRSRKVAGKKPQRRQCKLQAEMMELETQVAKVKEENRDWGESLLAVNAVKQAEAKRELLVKTRNLWMYNLLQLKVIGDINHTPINK